MFNLAFEAARLPARLLWRGLRWWWWRRGASGWKPMAQALGRATPPVPRLALPDGSVVYPTLAAPVSVVKPASTPAPGCAGVQEEGGKGGQEAADWPELARFHSREGDGFKVIFHFLLKKQRVRRTVWLDFTRLARRMGREPAWAMRARLGHAQMRYAVDRPTQPWGRVELPEVWLAVDSTRGQKARSFMLDTLDAVNALIDAGGIALVSGRHQSLPSGDAPPAGAAGVRRKSGSGAGEEAARAAPAQGELALAGADAGGDPPAPVAPMPAVLPDASQDNDGLPRGVVPEHVCTGILAASGVTERTDSTGRSYRIFYVDVEVDGRLSRQTGADLERALYDAHAKVGMRVRLQHLGHVPVNGGRHRRKVWHATVLPG